MLYTSLSIYIYIYREREGEGGGLPWGLPNAVFPNGFFAEVPQYTIIHFQAFLYKVDSWKPVGPCPIRAQYYTTVYYITYAYIYI